jgi:hypothetical protein
VILEAMAHKLGVWPLNPGNFFLYVNVVVYLVGEYSTNLDGSLSSYLVIGYFCFGHFAKFVVVPDDLRHSAKRQKTV